MERMISHEPKETRISIRINPEQKEIIAKAAHVSHISLSQFVIENSLHAAEQLLVDETQISMTEKQFVQFWDVVNRTPPKSLKAMQDLLNKPSILDE